MKYEELARRQKALKEKILLEEKQIPHHNFGDIVFYKGMTFNTMDDGQLILAHAYTHKSYGLEKPVLKHTTLKEIHDKIVVEFTKRGIVHAKFDELDAPET